MIHLEWVQHEKAIRSSPIHHLRPSPLLVTAVLSLVWAGPQNMKDYGAGHLVTTTL